MMRFFNLPSAYPVSAAWISGVVALVLISAGWVDLGPAITGFGFVCILIVLAVSQRQIGVVHNDLGVVHELVNSQRTAMAERIDALVAALTLAGVAIPVDPEQAKVQQAMRGATHDDDH